MPKLGKVKSTNQQKIKSTKTNSLLHSIRSRRRHRNRFGLAIERVGYAKFVRTTGVALEVGQGKVVGVEKLELADFGAEHTNRGAAAAWAEREARNEFFVKETPLNVQVNLVRGVADLAHGDAWHEFEILIFQIKLVAHLENVVLQQIATGLFLSRYWRFVQTGTDGVRKAEAQEKTTLVLGITTNGGVKDLLTVHEAFEHIVVALHQRIAEQCRVGFAVEEFRRKTQTNAYFFDLETESVVDLELGGAHFAGVVREQRTTQSEFVAHWAIVHQRVGAGFFREGSPGAAVVGDELVLVFKTRVTWVDQHRKRMVLGVNGLLLGKGGQCTQAEYEGKKYLFH
jgi:hypothetical protein